ncbi:MAG: hypothetical protein AB1898_22900 [Acidobacteriota bacterium]
MFRCNLCNAHEKNCKCDRLCTLCQSDDRVRLCEDGYYYCKDCREACDYRIED